MEKLIEQLQAQVKALQETVSARFSSVQPEQKNAEMDKLVAEVREAQAKIKELEQAKAVRKMVWGVSGKESPAGSERVPFSRFLKAIWTHDHGFLEQMKAPSGQSETVADGGYTVPVEYANEIIPLELQSSIVRQVARVFPMGSATRKVPRGLVAPLTYWTAEGTEPTALSKQTLAQVTQTAKKLISIVPFTTELLEDNTAGIDTFVAAAVAEAMGRQEDKMAFVGDVDGVTDPFKGVYFETGVNSASMDGATLSFGDLVNLLMAPKAPYRDRGAFVLSGTALKMVMKIADANLRPVWSMPEAGNPGRILGRPYYETDQIVDTLGTTQTNGTNTAILYGAWDALWVSPRGGYTVTASDSASTAAISAFSLDEVWYKFRRRESIDVVNPEAFAKLAVPTV